MTKLQMFLDSDQDQAAKQLSSYDYNMMNALELVAKGDFGKAAIYHQNVVHSLNNLQQMKNSKEQVNLILKQIEGRQMQDKLLHKMDVNIYE